MARVGSPSSIGTFGRRLRARLTPLPDLRQEEPAECGAVCLSLALAHFGRAVPVAEARAACNVSRDGASALDLVRAAERYGLVARAVGGGPDAILDLPVPAVVLLEKQHFVLLTGIGRAHVDLADPAIGPRRLDRRDFARLFAGVAIALSPGPSFRPGGERRAERPGQRDLLLWGLLVPTQFLAAWLVADGIAAGLDGRAPAMATILAAAAACAVAGSIQALLSDRWTRRDGVLAAATALGGGLDLPLEAWERHHSVALAGAVTDRAQAARAGVGRLFRRADLVLALASIAGVAIIAPAPGLAALVLAVLVWAASIALSRAGSVSHAAHVAAERSVARRLADALPVLAGLRGGGMERDLFDATAGATEEAEWRRLARGAWRLAGWSPALFGFAGFAGLIVWSGDALPLEPACLLLVGTAPWLVGMGRGGGAGAGETERKAMPPVDIASGSARPAGRLTAQRLSYARPGAAPCLEAVDLEIAPGERVALVGGSGAGKSTLLEILAGLRVPRSGAAMLDGNPIQELSAERRAAALGLFGQDIAFFDAPLRANLAGLDEGVPDDTITEATQSLGLHERIVRRRLGYRTNLAGDAPQFSGGERALIDLARLLVLAPPVLLLDEPTAALDPESERRAWEAILASGATVLVATHSPAIAASCDRSLLLSDGRIMASGPHAILLETEPAYRQVIGDE